MPPTTTTTKTSSLARRKQTNPHVLCIVLYCHGRAATQESPLPRPRRRSQITSCADTITPETAVVAIVGGNQHVLETKYPNRRRSWGTSLGHPHTLCDGSATPPRKHEPSPQQCALNVKIELRPNLTVVRVFRGHRCTRPQPRLGR